MSLLIVRPLPFTVLGSTSQSNAPASNLNLDHPSMVWRSTDLAGEYVDIDLGGSFEWDTIALVGANASSATRARVRADATQSNIALTSGAALDTLNTIKAEGTVDPAENLLLYRSGNTRTERFIRFSFANVSEPTATYYQGVRLVVGKALVEDGVDVGADLNFEDPSQLTDYRGFTTADAYTVKQSWKFSVSNLKDTRWLGPWRSLLTGKGAKTVLFIPNTDSTLVSQEAVFGRIVPPTNASNVSYDLYKANLYIKEV